MGSTERIRDVARRVAKWHDAGHQIVVVPSAMSGETNRLIGLADRHVILERGRIAWRGTSAELDADRVVWHRYLGV